MSCTKKVPINLNNSRSTCRVCMRKNNLMKELFGSDSKIVHRIQFCTGILLIQTPSLPSFICVQCLSHLNIAYNFKTTCIVSDKVFKKDVKIETTTEIEDTTVEEEIEDLHEDEVEIEDTKETMGLLFEKEPDTINIEKLPSQTEVIVKQSLNSTNTIKLRVVCKKEQATKNEKAKASRKKVKRLTFRKLFCLKCNIRFDSKEDSIEHHETIHSTTKYVCEFCGKQFVYQASHSAHMRIHAGPSYACAHCSYATVNKSDLRKHITLHTGEKNFHCHACPGAFRTSSNLQNHIRHKHGGQKTFPCDRCDKSFFSGHRLRRHLDAHNNVKRHECPVCHSYFSRRCHWKKHLLKQHAVRTPPVKPGRRGTRRLETVSLIQQ